MGLSVHYKGKLRAKEMLPLLIDEVKDIAGIYDWKCYVFERNLEQSGFGKNEFNNSLYGICFSPPACEPVCLTFLSNGIVCSPTGLNYYSETKSVSLMYGVSVKTQFAGTSVHKLIVHLFDYLSQKYLDDFEFDDEAEYWNSRDEKKLEEKFEMMNKLLHRVEGIIKTVKIESNGTFEDYFEELIRKLKGANFKDI